MQTRDVVDMGKVRARQRSIPAPLLDAVTVVQAVHDIRQAGRGAAGACAAWHVLSEGNESRWMAPLASSLIERAWPGCKFRFRPQPKEQRPDGTTTMEFSFPPSFLRRVEFLAKNPSGPSFISRSSLAHNLRWAPGSKKGKSAAQPLSPPPSQPEECKSPGRTHSLWL